MGLLVGGKWVVQGIDTLKTGGRFIRSDSQFRSFVTRDGSSGFRGDSGRYHLYIARVCPWAHRTLIMRSLKNLENDISISVVNPQNFENGWTFEEYEGSTPDTINNSKYLYEVYLKANPEYEGRVTIPILWDKETNTIVNNESSEIILMMNNGFNCGNDRDFYPEEKKAEIDEINAFVYDKINNGVYKAGHAGTQKVYEEAVRDLFNALEVIDQRLENQRYLVGNTLTIADVRIFTTIIRFDVAYVGIFKCNLKRIDDFKNLPEYLRDLYQTPGFGENVNFDHIKVGYYKSIKINNPSGIVPLGPIVDYDRPHNRDKVYGASSH